METELLREFRRLFGSWNDVIRKLVDAEDGGDHTLAAALRSEEEAWCEEVLAVERRIEQSGDLRAMAVVAVMHNPGIEASTDAIDTSAVARLVKAALHAV